MVASAVWRDYLPASAKFKVVKDGVERPDDSTPTQYNNFVTSFSACHVVLLSRGS
jgi:hypothetical protein